MRQPLRTPICVFIGIVTLGLIGCAEQEELSAEHPGLQTYMKYCASCHNAGVADAPKLGEADQWKSRIEKGSDALLQATIDGIPPGMPKKGLCMSCSEEQLVDAIDYMLDALDS